MSRLMLRTAVLLFLVVWAGHAYGDLTRVRVWGAGHEGGGLCYTQDTGRVWIADGGEMRLWKHTRTGDLLDYFHTDIWLNAYEPYGLEYMPGTGDMWVIDRYFKKAVRFERHSGHLEYISSFNLGSVMDNPIGIAFHPGNGNLYITDYSLSKVYRWTTGGFLLGSWSTYPPLLAPTSICCMSSEGTFLIGSVEGVIYEFTTGGLLRAAYDLYDQFGIANIWGLSFDPVAGTAFVQDAYNNDVIEIVGFTEHTSVPENQDVATTWGAIKTLYK